VVRQHSRDELRAAEIFHAWPANVFEPSGEELGTAYDDSASCPECGSGATQQTPLLLDSRRIPRRLDCSETIAHEIVVSGRFVEVFHQNGLVGASFDPVVLSDAGAIASRDFFQFRVQGSSVELNSKTRFGEDPFDTASSGRCPRGDLAGLNLLSEVTIRRQSWPEGVDIAATRQFVGVRSGVLRPRPLILLSGRARRVIEDAKLNGFCFDIARIE
jgi:hypothetical protein